MKIVIFSLVYQMFAKGRGINTSSVKYWGVMILLILVGTIIDYYLKGKSK